MRDRFDLQRKTIPGALHQAQAGRGLAAPVEHVEGPVRPHPATPHRDITIAVRSLMGESIAEGHQNAPRFSK